MAPTIEQVMLGLEARLDTIPGLRTSATVRDAINPPFAMVGPPDIPEYRETFKRGRYRLQFTVTVLVSKVVDRVGQMRLAAFASPTGASSVPSAIEADKTLGGIVEECWVTAYRNLGSEDVGAIGYYGGVFDVAVISAGV